MEISNRIRNSCSVTRDLAFTMKLKPHSEQILIQENYFLQKVKDADIVIFAGGISPSLEGEEMGVNLPGFRKGDRTDTVSYTHLDVYKRQLWNAWKHLLPSLRRSYPHHGHYFQQKDGSAIQ